MGIHHFTWLVVLLAMSATQASACAVRLGYPDRERAPYYLGNGSAIPARPGAAVELMSAALASAGCTVTLVRLPTARLKVALSVGEIDMAPVDLPPGAVPYSALPLTEHGLPDPRRVWLSASNGFYQRYPRQTEAVWTWFGHQAAPRLGELVEQYLAMDRQD